jgi:hypothetical protein
MSSARGSNPSHKEISAAGQFYRPAPARIGNERKRRCFAAISLREFQAAVFSCDDGK